MPIQFFLPQDFFHEFKLGNCKAIPNETPFCEQSAFDFKFVWINYTQTNIGCRTTTIASKQVSKKQGTWLAGKNPITNISQKLLSTMMMMTMIGILEWRNGMKFIARLSAMPRRSTRRAEVTQFKFKFMIWLKRVMQSFAAAHTEYESLDEPVQEFGWAVAKPINFHRNYGIFISGSCK